MENLKIYEAVRAVPQNAQKKIQGGRLNGKTDINPMWRLKMLTEQFGPAGIGWYYNIKEERLEPGPDGEVAAFVRIDLFVKVDGEWSKPITGVGGSSFVAKERSGLYVSDECFKMALTDAISVSCKALGFGADIYWEADKTKYDQPAQSKQSERKPSVFLDSYLQDAAYMQRMLDWLCRAEAKQGSAFKAYNVIESNFITTPEQRQAIIAKYNEYKASNTAA